MFFSFFPFSFLQPFCCIFLYRGDREEAPYLYLRQETVEEPKIIARTMVMLTASLQLRFLESTEVEVFQDMLTDVQQLWLQLTARMI